MGALNCLEQCRAQERRQHLLVLHQGAEFKRKKYLLGIVSGSERIHLRLNTDEQTLIWKQLDGNKSVKSIHVGDVHVIKPQGTTGFSIVSQTNETLLEVEADSEEIRNDWVTNLQQLCEENTDGGTSDQPLASNSSFRHMIEEKKRKQAYWAERTQELEDRKKDAEERKKKFGTTGMKYTAIAMSNRPSITKNND